MFNSFNSRLFLIISLLLLLPALAVAAGFDGKAGITIEDPCGGLSWQSGIDALSVYCWFKISVPSDTLVSGDMMILADSAGGGTGSYAIRYNYSSGKVEFLCNGPGGPAIPLIEEPYLDRWYHVAIVRIGDYFYPHVDGVERPAERHVVGNTGNTAGISIGCSGANDQYFMGEIQEVAIFQGSILNSVPEFMFLDLPTDYHDDLNLYGYYKLNESDRGERYRNSSAIAPPGTEQGTKRGMGKITVADASVAVEQSLFDAKKNGGRDATVPLSGAFSWGDSALYRNTPGIPFEFSLKYSSSIAGQSRLVEAMQPNVMSPGWRHNFEMRMVPAQSSSERRIAMPDGSIETWDRNGMSYETRHKEYRGKLTMLPDFNFEWETPDHIKYRFYDPTYAPYLENQRKGRLYEVEDLNGNKLQLTWDLFNGHLLHVADTAGDIFYFGSHRKKLVEILPGKACLTFKAK